MSWARSRRTGLPLALAVAALTACGTIERAQGPSDAAVDAAADASAADAARTDALAGEAAITDAPAGEAAITDAPVADAAADAPGGPEGGTADEGSPFGVVHLADLCEPAMADIGFVANWWDQGGSPSSLASTVSAESACGKMEVPLMWTAPDWNDTQAHITSAMTDYFSQNPGVPVWQFGWEENISGRCCSPSQLDTLLEELSGVAAARSAAGGSARLAYQIVTTGMADIQAFLASPAAGLVDVLALHPYDWTEFRTPEVWLATGDPTGVLERVAGWIATSANPSMAIHLTEVGAPVCDAPGGCRLDAGGSDVRGQDPEENAAWMVKVHVLSFSAGVARVLWYQRGFAPDPVCATGSDPESCFGMTSAGGPRPVLAAYQTMTRCLAGTSRLPTFSAPQPGVRAYRFGPSGGGGACTVAWSFDATTSPTLPSGPVIAGVSLGVLAGGATVTSAVDTTGSATFCSGAGCAGASLTLSPAPVFIESD